MKKKGERPREKFLKPFANKQREPVRSTGTLNLQFTIYNEFTMTKFSTHQYLMFENRKLRFV